MSRVTNVILVADTYIGTPAVPDGDAWAEQRLAPINAWLAEHGHIIGLVSVEDPKLPDSWYGGSKCLECNVAIGAFNYLDVEAFVAFLEGFPWGPEDGSTHLNLVDQDDWCAQFIDLYLHAREQRPIWLVVPEFAGYRQEPRYFTSEVRARAFAEAEVKADSYVRSRGADDGFQWAQDGSGWIYENEALKSVVYYVEIAYLDPTSKGKR